MKKLTFLLITALFAITLSGCGGDEVSFSTQEDSRRQAIENAEYNARDWRDSNKPDFNILMRGDSSINSTCAPGDGWASVDLVKGNTKIPLKCSTVSGTVGCLTKEDFQQRSYAKEDGRCNHDLPVPLPKIVM